MNDENNKKPLSDEENYDELLKNFLPHNESETEIKQPVRKPVQKPVSQTERRQGIYFSQAKNKNRQAAAAPHASVPHAAAAKPAEQNIREQPVRNAHILQPEKDTAPRKTQTYVQQPYPANGAQTQSRPSQSTVAFPAQTTGSTAPAPAQRSAQPPLKTPVAADRAPVRSAQAHAKRPDSTVKQKKSESTTTQSINKKTEGNGKKKSAQSAKYTTMLRVVICLASVTLIIAASALIKIPLMGCINDIIAIDGTDDEVSVTITEGMTTWQIINMLGKKGLINNALFCNVVSDFLGYDSKTEYPAGTYMLNSEMGVEGMLAEIVAAGKDTKTVSLTFPEGYTVEQIIARLASNGIASTGSLYAAINDYEFTGMFEYLNGIKDSKTRFSALEGYLYPDTYDFYVGENPNSVIKKFLANFEEKWTDVYASRAEELGYSLDDILKVASIVEKEAFDAQQMPIVASVLYNRLGASALYPHLECDSTTDYIEKLFDDTKINNAEYYSLLMLYDTYQVKGLPEGPVCNPGGDAIKAALYPDSTLYYYFMHDKSGNIYLASTAEEHAANAVAAGISQ